MIIEELNMNYQPFFVHYWGLLCNLKREYGHTNLVFQKSMHTKIQKMLLEKVEEI